MRNQFFVLFFLLFTAASAGAQDDEWRARADVKEVVVNGVFKVHFTLENADGSDVTFPDFEGFEVFLEFAH